MANNGLEFDNEGKNIGDNLPKYAGKEVLGLKASAGQANSPVAKEDSTTPHIDAHSRNERVVSPGSEQDRGSGVNECESSTVGEDDKPIYTQRYLDQFEKNAQELVDQQVERAEIAEKDAAEKKRRIEEILSRQRHREELIGKAGEMVGDGSYAQLHAFVIKFVENQLEAERIPNLEAFVATTKQQFENSHRCFLAEKSKKESLEQDNQNLQRQLTQAQGLYQEATDSNKSMQAKIEEFETLRRRCTKAIIPPCLSSQEWFSSFFEELQGVMNNDPVFDPAVLVLSSLAEFAVMERNPAAACFDWRKQLLDIGLVVANYMHQKKAPESESLKLLRNFASALQSSETVARSRIELFIPSLGPDFNIERVKHLRGGTSVAKVINWGVLEPNGPYAKAIVE